MKDNDPRTSEYFNTLSVLVQESIMQSGVTFNDDDELRNYVTNLDQIRNRVE